ncbi:MAG: M50 family metallopeptidase [Acidimicrobiales bacterium]
MIDAGVLGQRLADLTDGELIRLFWGAVVLSLVLPRIPYGRLLLYPFALLGTWAHEMGHGLTALFTGGRFRRLVIYRNLDGLAYFETGSLRRALVAAGGLLAPAVVGGAFIVAGSREATAPFILTGLAGALVVSLVLFVRNAFGWVALALVAAALVPVARYAPETVRIFVAQMVGIQLCVASWGSLDYMFTPHFHRSDGTYTESDTQMIANVLLLPYWFWGALIAALSITILAGSFYLAWIAPSV